MAATSTQTIAKNTVFLYFRMALVTVVGLYTSRVILQTLGIEDFGIYNVAGSVVALFSFITGALGQSSSRFITVEIGKVKDDDISQLVSCFRTTRTIHGLLALLIFLVCETIGLLILYNSSIPDERMLAAFWVFQISVFTAMLNVTQIPFTALIIAHERMRIYAYISIVEVFAKLAVCYLLIISPIDKLVYYALLLLIVQVVVLFTYRIYANRNFLESSMAYGFDKSFFKPLMSFSFWNLFGALSSNALTQGTTILVSFFFGPSIVAGRAIANQVKSHVINFVTNFRMAINPQILKRNAAGEIESYKQLLLWSTNITFYMMLLFVLPLVFTSRVILEMWLEEVPPFATEFLQIALIEMLFYVYDVTFYQIFQAEGRLRENAIICPMMDMVGLVIVYVVYLMGGSVLAIAWMMLVLTFVQGMIVKPWLAVKMFRFKWFDFFNVYFNNLKVMLVSLVLPTLIYYLLQPTIMANLFLVVISVISVLASSFHVGMNRDERTKISGLVISKIRRSLVSR